MISNPIGSLSFPRRHHSHGAGWRLRASLCLGLMTTLTSCLPPECIEDCANEVVWDAEMPTDLTWSGVRASTFTVCRNGSCLEGSLSRLHEEAPISGGARSRTSSTHGLASVTFSFARTETGFVGTVSYFELEFLSGDHFDFEIQTPMGTVAVSETVDEFMVVVPVDDHCETCLAARLGDDG